MIAVLLGIALVISGFANVALWFALAFAARQRDDARHDADMLDRKLVHVEREYREALGRLSRKKRPHQILANPTRTKETSK